MRTIFNFRNALLLFVVLCVGSLSFSSCSDEPASENLYTFKGEMASDYLQNRSDKYSDFVTILTRAKALGLLATYGEYTCFAPTNEAIEQYLQGRGMTSLAELSDADCDTIAYSHIIKKAYFTTDLNIGAIPDVNMEDRYLTLACDTDANNNIQYFINKDAQIIVRDDSVENGVVHTLNKVISSSNDMLPDVMEQDELISLFFQALHKTHMDDSLKAFIDPKYTIGEDSVIDGIPYHTAVENEVAKFPAKYKIAFTVFAEPDSVFKKYGIETLEQLEQKAKEVYDEVYPEDAGLYDNDPTNRKNPLNRFVSYHILDRIGTTNTLTVTGNTRGMFRENLADITDWYETMMPYSVMQISSPRGKVYINRKGLKDKFEVEGVRFWGDKEALNGFYQYLDKPLFYDVTTRDKVLKCRFRFDASTLSPDFMNQGARGKEMSRTDPQPTGGFKNGYLKNWKFTESTLVACRIRTPTFWSYEGDEVILQGQYDFTIKLPPVPAGTYELRVGYCAWSSRGVVQTYFGTKNNMKPYGIPVDMRLNASDNKGKWESEKVGWKVDQVGSSQAVQDYNMENDKAMHNRGYMKWPDCVGSANGGESFRNAGSQLLRRVLLVETLQPGQDYYIRFKQTLESSTSEYDFDYLEMCPKEIYDSPQGEDTH